MARVHEGELTAKGKRFGVVVSRFNEAITKELLDGTLNHLRRSGVSEAAIQVAWVPGAFEIPLALKQISESKPDGLIALGCIIRGETSNYAHIAQSVTDGIQRVMLDCRIPVGFGLLTVENFDQAIARSGGKVGNKGREAAQSAIEMANVLAQIPAEKAGLESRKVLLDSTRDWPRTL